MIEILAREGRYGEGRIKALITRFVFLPDTMRMSQV